MRLFLYRLYSNSISLICSWFRFSFSTTTRQPDRNDRHHHPAAKRPRTNTAMPGGGTATTGPKPPSTPPPLTPQQRQRMEANRGRALVKLLARQHCLTEQQQQILSAVSQGRSVFITGSGGTGKTFLLRHIIRLLRDIHPTGSAVFVTASTGVAACALDGQTLHSFAGIGLGTADVDRLFFKASSEEPAKRWRSARALVIDEVSMIDGELFDKLDSIGRRMRPEAAAVPWGGIQLVVSGDFFQLPPVKPPNPTKEFAFEADCWAACFDLQLELTHIFRQSDSRLIDMLQGIRRGRRDKLHLLDRCITHGPDSEPGDPSQATRLFPRNEDVRRVNNERLRNLGMEIMTYRAVDTGEDPWKAQLKLGIAPDELEICSGARVMLIKNTDIKSRLVNGATGVVVGFEGERVLPRVRFDCGVEKVLEPEIWEVTEGETVRAKRRQIPLILAWALSVHKCQGMTLDCLHTDLSRAFGCGMVYVALSRVRSLDGLRLSGFDPWKIKAHPKVVHFYNHLLNQQ